MCECEGEGLARLGECACCRILLCWPLRGLFPPRGVATKAISQWISTKQSAPPTKSGVVWRVTRSKHPHIRSHWVGNATGCSQATREHTHTSPELCSPPLHAHTPPPHTCHTSVTPLTHPSHIPHSLPSPQPRRSAACLLQHTSTACLT